MPKSTYSTMNGTSMQRQHVEPIRESQTDGSSTSSGSIMHRTDSAQG